CTAYFAFCNKMRDLSVTVGPVEKLVAELTYARELGLTTLRPTRPRVEKFDSPLGGGTPPLSFGPYRRAERFVVADVVRRVVWIRRKDEKDGVRIKFVLDRPYHRWQVEADGRVFERDFRSVAPVVDKDR